jgi:putative heme transporter
MFLRKSAKPEKQQPYAVVPSAVPPGMQIAGAWSWRIIVIAGVFALFIFLIMQLRLIVIPFLVAVLLAALLVPFSQWLQKHGWPKWLAVTVSELGLIVIVAGLIVLVVTQIVSGYSDLQSQTVQSLDNFKAWLLTSPLHLTEAQINDYAKQLWESIQTDSQWLVSGAVSIGSGFGHLLTGALLTIFTTLYMLIDGRRIWNWILGILPRRARPAMSVAGDSGWLTLTTFVKVQIFVAAVDAVGIGLGALILGLPLVVPIAVAVFLGSFIPVVGAVLTGVLAVFVALVFKGPVIALIMLGVVILVQQIEGHVLQPLVMGTAVKVHPLAVVLAVATGGFIAGIPGALFAVPVIAVLNVMITSIARGEWRTNPAALLLSQQHKPATDSSKD